MANRLVRENSVYLQQHGNNPVDWYPWGQEAFQKARDENKLLLISIGYSTCHWCHVMETESFESAEVAQILNERFVAIKVDREEHPDVDSFYMEALQSLTRRGGWPLNMFATPDLKPFFGGTYFPREVFVDLLANVHRVWTEEPSKILEQAQGLQSHLTQKSLFDHSIEASAWGVLRDQKTSWQTKLIDTMLRDYDPVWGGFGMAPKFPRPHGLFSLVRAARSSSDLAQTSTALVAVQQTLKGMAYGGLRDHLKGGFHRYSTDAEWRVPHFEKMLYDQALLIQAYGEAFKLTHEDFPRDIVKEMLRFLEVDLRLSSGLFAAAQDADSEGIEGQYYVWSYEQVGETLKDEAQGFVERFARLHSLSLEGNWEGNNILTLSLDVPWKDWASPDMQGARQKLLAVRERREKPLTDDKAIVSWNAWMATGLLHASFDVLRDPELSEGLLLSAQRTVAALRALFEGDQLPRVAYQVGTTVVRKGQGYLEDYVALIEAIQMLASRTASCELWDSARELVRFVERAFRDSQGQLQSRQVGLHSELPTSSLDFHDGATPSSLSIWVGCGLRQALIDSDLDLRGRVLKDLAPYERVLREHPYAVTHLLSELDLLKAFVLKVPQGRLSEVLAEWALHDHWPNEVLLTTTEASTFEACDFESCFAVSDRLKDVWRA